MHKIQQIDKKLVASGAYMLDLKDYKWEVQFTEFKNNFLYGRWRFEIASGLGKKYLEANVRFRMELQTDGSYRARQFFCDEQSWDGTTFRAWDNNTLRGSIGDSTFWLVHKDQSIPLIQSDQLYIQNVT